MIRPNQPPELYTPPQREVIRRTIIERAEQDERILGGALTGSAAAGREDRWSDIDLAFGVVDQAAVDPVLDDWTRYMIAEHGALHHMDVHAGAWVYRVFLLANTLQVDLAFTPIEHFGALAPTFQLLFGQASDPPKPKPRDVESLIGWAWLYALHVRSSLARGRLLQAQYMINGLRNTVGSLACLRHGLPASEGRGLDDLPELFVQSFAQSVVQRIETGALSAAFAATVDLLIAEIRHADEALADRLTDPLRAMVGPHPG